MTINNQKIDTAKTATILKNIEIYFDSDDTAKISSAFTCASQDVHTDLGAEYVLQYLIGYYEAAISSESACIRAEGYEFFKGLDAVTKFEGTPKKEYDEYLKYQEVSKRAISTDYERRAYYTRFDN